MTRLFDRTVTVQRGGGVDDDGYPVPPVAVPLSRRAFLDVISSVELPGSTAGLMFTVDTRYRLIFEPGAHVRELDGQVEGVEVSGETRADGRPAKFRLIGRPTHSTRGVRHTSANLQLIEANE